MDHILTSKLRRTLENPQRARKEGTGVHRSNRELKQHGVGRWELRKSSVMGKIKLTMLVMVFTASYACRQ